MAPEDVEAGWNGEEGIGSWAFTSRSRLNKRKRDSQDKIWSFMRVGASVCDRDREHSRR